MLPVTYHSQYRTFKFPGLVGRFLPLIFGFTLFTQTHTCQAQIQQTTEICSIRSRHIGKLLMLSIAMAVV